MRRPLWRLAENARFKHVVSWNIKYSSKTVSLWRSSLRQVFSLSFTKIMQALWYLSYANCNVNVNASLRIRFVGRKVRDVWNCKHQTRYDCLTQVLSWLRDEKWGLIVLLDRWSSYRVSNRHKIHWWTQIGSSKTGDHFI